MVAVKRDLYIEQGASFIEPFQWCRNDGTEDAPVVGDPYDLTGYEARMQVRKKQHMPAKVDATTANGKIVLGKDPETGAVDLATGWITILLSDEDTDLLDSKTMLYDLEVVDPTGFVYRLLEGSITVSPNITQDQTEDPEVTE